MPKHSTHQEEKYTLDMLDDASESLASTLVLEDSRLVKRILMCRQTLGTKKVTISLVGSAANYNAYHFKLLFPVFLIKFSWI